MENHNLHPNIKWRLFIGFITVTIQMMIHPFLVLYFNRKIGIELTGVLYIFVIVSAVCGSFLSGLVSDRIGRKKVLVLTELMMGVTYGILALFNSPWFDFPYLSIGIVIINHFFAGSFYPVSMSLILDSSTASNREFIFRMNYWVNTIAISLGSLIGGFFFLTHSFLFFSLETGGALFSVLITIFYIKEEYVVPHKATPSPNKTTKERIREARKILRNYKEIVNDRVFLLFISGSILLFSIENQLTNYIGVNLSENQLVTSLAGWKINGSELLGILKFENTLLIVLGTFVVPLVIKKLSQRGKLLIGVLLFTGSYSALTLLHRPLFLILTMVIASFGQLLYVPTRQTVLGDITPEQKRGSYMAVNQMTTYMGEIVAGAFLVMGTILSNLPAAMIFLILGTACTLLYHLMLIHEEKKQQSEVNVVGMH